MMLQPGKALDVPAVSVGSGKPKVLGLSDALTAPTGFGRVGRELFTRLADAGEFDLGYMAYNWPGSRRFPGVQTYAESAESPHVFCQAIFPKAAIDFAGTDHFVLWTLMDTWMASWLSNPESSPLSHPASARYLQRYRDQFTWLGHFPIDGRGPRNGPPRWVELVLNAVDVPVMMSEWAAKLCQPWVKKPLRWISHAVNDEFHAQEQRQWCRAIIESQYLRFLQRHLAATRGDEETTPQQLMEELEANRFKLGDRFTIICTMANRARKYWPTVLRAFSLLLEKVPDARFIGICGDRVGHSDDQWALETICQELPGVRLDYKAKDPNVWLIDHVTQGPGALSEDAVLRWLIRLSNVSVLLGGGEGFGLPQLEAHACGVPCFVGDYSASTELIVDSMEGLSPRGFFDVSQNETQRPIYRAADLADKLWYAKRNPGWCEDVGAKGMEQAAQRRWHHILPQWITVLKEAGMGPASKGEDHAPGAGAAVAVP